MAKRNKTKMPDCVRQSQAAEEVLPAPARKVPTSATYRLHPKYVHRLDIFTVAGKAIRLCVFGFPVAGTPTQLRRLQKTLEDGAAMCKSLRAKLKGGG